MSVIYFPQKNEFKKVLPIIKSPFLGLGISLVSLMSYFFMDKPLAWFIKIHTSSNSLFHSVINLITKFGEGGLYVLLFGFLFLFNRYKLKNTAEAKQWLYLLVVASCSGLICDLLKFIFGRARPLALFDHHDYGFYFFKTRYIYVSFPSGHATTAAAVAVGLALLWPRYWKECFIAAFFVALSRVLMDVHFLSDVLMGLYLGAMIALGVAYSFKRWFSVPGQL